MIPFPRPLAARLTLVGTIGASIATSGPPGPPMQPEPIDSYYTRTIEGVVLDADHVGLGFTVDISDFDELGERPEAASISSLQVQLEGQFELEEAVPLVLYRVTEPWDGYLDNRWLPTPLGSSERLLPRMEMWEASSAHPLDETYAADCGDVLVRADSERVIRRILDVRRRDCEPMDWDDGLAHFVLLPDGPLNFSGQVVVELGVTAMEADPPLVWDLEVDAGVGTVAEADDTGDFR